MKSMRIFGVALMMLMAGGMQAQTVKETADSVVSGVKSGNVKEAYSKIKDSFELKRVNAEKLIGTWDYKEPAVYTTKGNILFRMAGNAVADQLEKLLLGYIEKAHITSDNTQFTFYKDGHFDRNVADRKASGVWIVSEEKLVLGINNLMTADITTHYEDGELMLLIDIDKLMNAFKALGAIKDTKSNKQLIKLSKRIPGVQAGFLLVKKQ